MFQEPETKSSATNRAYNGESEITDNVSEGTQPDIYQLPDRVNSAHNRSVDGDLSDSTWPPEIKPDPWNKGIEEISVNSNDIIAAKDNRLSAVVHNMWEL